MPNANELLRETGDEVLDAIKKEYKELLSAGKSESEQVIRETAEKVEQWVKMRAEGSLDNDELEALLNARKRTVRQFLLMQEIKARARLERVSLGLLDLVLNKLIGAVLHSSSRFLRNLWMR